MLESCPGSTPSFARRSRFCVACSEFLGCGLKLLICNPGEIEVWIWSLGVDLGGRVRVSVAVLNSSCDVMCDSMQRPKCPVAEGMQLERDLCIHPR